MVLLTSLLWGLLTILGLRSPTDSPPTDLAGGVSCRGLEVKDGHVSCSNEPDKTVCQVVCGGEDHGDFTCTPEEGWSPELPTCAKPIDDDYDYDYSEVEAQTGGCPDNQQCHEMCHKMGRKSGWCIGVDKKKCTCTRS